MASSNSEADDTPLDWDETGTPISRQFGDVYYSREHGLAESRHVFLHHNHLAERFATPGTSHFSIGETGFGTGLNFLAVWQLWRERAPTGKRLHFTSVEKYPLNPEQLESCLGHWPELAVYSGQLLDAYPPLTPGFHSIELDHGQVTLHLLIGDAETQLDDLGLSGLKVDAWFLDGFAPARNPAMWTPALFNSIARLSRPGTSVASFTAAGQVRRDLQAAGFTMEKVAGYGRKRAMLRGQWAGPAPSLEYKPAVTPWFVPRTHRKTRAKIAIIGAGLAGSHVAAYLAKRQHAVSVFEQNSDIASGASGNPQAVLYAKLSASAEIAADFSLQSYLYACQHYRRLFQQGRLQPRTDGELQGSLQLTMGDNSRRQHQKLAATFGRWPSLLATLDQQSASQLAGVALPCGALHLPASGWLAPKSVCRALLAEPGVTVNTDCRVTQVLRAGERWQLTLDKQTSPLEFDQVVIANSTGASSLLPNQLLPIKPVRGQISLLPWPANTAAPRLPICHEGYISPPLDGVTCIGATYDVGANHEQTTVADHQQNLDQLQQAIPELLSDGFRSWDANLLQGRAAVRATTSDYLPFAGPVPDHKAFITDFAPLTRNARRVIPTYGNYQPGLFVCAGLGSRGLAYAPLVAALVGSYLLGEPLPLNWRLARALSPARALIRAISRGEVNSQTGAV